MSKNEKVLEEKAVETIEDMEAVEATEGSNNPETSGEKVKEPTKEQIIAAYQELNTKYEKLFKAYADLLDLYLGNKPVNR